MTWTWPDLPPSWWAGPHIAILIVPALFLGAYLGLLLAVRRGHRESVRPPREWGPGGPQQFP